MPYDAAAYKGLLVQGRLREALDYLSGFPEQAALLRRTERRFTSPRPLYRGDDPLLAALDKTFQTYYNEVFWLALPQPDCDARLLGRLVPLAGIPESDLPADVTAAMELVENHLAELLLPRGVHYLGGRTQGYFGPYIWRTTTEQTAQVELPGRVQPCKVCLLSDFIANGWLDYISLGQIGAAGWQDGDTLYCVLHRYRGGVESEAFQVSFLKHEAQHSYDREVCGETAGVLLEYRAKLVELIYSSGIGCFKGMLCSADDASPANSHAYAAWRIVRDLSLRVFEEEYVADYARWQHRVRRVRQAALDCYQESYRPETAASLRL